MSVTYTTAAERDRHRSWHDTRRAWPEPLLMATSLVAALALVLACAGRLRAVDAAEIGGGRPANLNGVRSAAALEPALETVFANPSDRRFAAAELFRFLSGDGTSPRSLPNVGAISRATTSPSAVRGTRNLQVFAERMRAGQDAREARPESTPLFSPLFTAGDLAKLKPFLSVRTRDEFKNQVWLFGALYVAAFHLVALFWRRRGVRTDLLLLAAAHLLTAIGFAVLLSRPDPLRDSLLFVRYAETIVLGLGLMAALSLVNVAAMGFISLSYLPLLAALSLSVLLIFFGSGPGSSSAKVNLGPVQPIEAIRLLLALFLAGYFARRWELLRDVRSDAIRDVRLPAWINLPRVEYVLPVLVGVAAALLFFFFQKDLGPALFLCCVFLAVYAVARGRVGMAVTGLVLLAAGFYLGYRLQVSATLADRVRMWQSPWDNAVAGGNQVTHAIWAMATGGTFGTGLGLGDSRYLPAGHTDLILAAVGEELGAFGLIGVTGLFAGTGMAGLPDRAARRQRLRVLSGHGADAVSRPSGTDHGLWRHGRDAAHGRGHALSELRRLGHARELRGAGPPLRDPRRPPSSQRLRAVSRADEVSRGHARTLRARARRRGRARPGPFGRRLRRQAAPRDARRWRPAFQYNPRMVDLIRQLPRGTIYDRRGLPLATDDARVLAAARQAYETLGVSIARACPNPAERCYPLGGKAFHVLGDARTGKNWTATNTSYVERDADARLRGFDDHASTVKTLDRGGQPMYTIHRDYRELVPVLRHRHQPEHAAVEAFMRRSRDVHLTIDANLQLRVSSIVASYARKAQGKAAAVVLDPDTGAVLASASYPWPASPDPPASAGDAEADVWLDRARYGAYPPGSTFKLVVALAALRAGATDGRYTCTRLPDGRIGARVDGWARPVRDDVLDTHPHGTIDMHDGLVHSCNAYFAQLAVSLGPIRSWHSPTSSRYR